MLSDLSNLNSEVGTNIKSDTKMMEKTGKMSDIMKKFCATTHEIGNDCKCSRYKCFQVVSLEE